MSNITHIVKGQARSRFLVTARRSFAVGALGVAMLLGRVAPAEAALPVHPCTAELNQLLAEWNEAGFAMPSKPGQAIVRGRNGRVASGGEVAYMAGQIRQAVWDCQDGNVAAVQQRVALVSDRLHQLS
jgi:hypothetical protein